MWYFLKCRSASAIRAKTLTVGLRAHAQRGARIDGVEQKAPLLAEKPLLRSAAVDARQSLPGARQTLQTRERAARKASQEKKKGAGSCAFKVCMQSSRLAGETWPLFTRREPAVRALRPQRQAPLARACDSLQRHWTAPSIGRSIGQSWELPPGECCVGCWS